jgi:hypothetical protein
VSDNTTHAYVTGGAIPYAPGAGIANIRHAALTNTTVTNNGEITPGGLGGGIFSNGTLALRNDTISQNVASAYAGDGGNLYNAGSAASVTAKNAIIAEALTSGNCGGTLPTSLGNDLGFESTGDTYPCFTPGNGNVFADPMLGPLQDNGGPTQTEAIGPGSAALDAGSGCEATDQRGLFRGGTAGPCDIGAFELNASPPDTTPPTTSITKLTVNSAKHKAIVRFRGTDPAPSSLPLDFKCKIDKKPYGACSSPKTYRHLKVGKHKFRVKARDAAGNLDLTPAVKRFRIKP